LFFKNRGVNSWSVDALKRRMSSRFGFVEVRVQTKPDGTPDFDRAVYGEAPNINAVCWGIDQSTGKYKVGVVVQSRPFADNPDGTAAEQPIVFGQPCVMAFSMEKLVGIAAMQAFEAPSDTVVREALEELGSAVIGRPQSMGHHNPNPTFCATWSGLFEVQIDLEKLQQPTDTTELIHRAEYLPVSEIVHRISVGEHDGVNYRSATANNAFFVWLARHPEAWRT
jgi:hypothetical protein